ncbi:MAG TPA: DJ-1/PfpI family protein [Chthoniobacterales bacterium]|nr:DJ-1/PfpI family protein [Chthoniobacterales bacterium]
MTPKRIGILGFDGVTAMHLAGAADSFAAAALEDGFGGRINCYEVQTIGLTSAPFRTDSGMLITPQRNLQTAGTFDTLIVPGGTGLRKPEMAQNIADCILARFAETRRLATICTGIFGLAPTGLLDGRTVTTNWRYASDVRKQFPNIRVDHTQRLIKDGPFYTSAGLTAAVDLSLALVEEDYGPYVARSLSRDFVMYLARRDEEIPTPGISLDSQPANYPVDRFAELVSWIVRNLHADLSVEVLARRACICPSHFSKAFKSVFGSPPSAFVENLRLNEARRCLSARRKTLHAIAASVGFADSAAFNRAFERRFGVLPSKCLPKRRSVSAPDWDRVKAA